MQRSFSSPAPDKTLDPAQWLHTLGLWVARYWRSLLLIGFALVILLEKDVAINLQMQGGPQDELANLGRQWLAPAPSPESVAPLKTEARPTGSLPVESGQEGGHKPQPGLFARLLAWFSTDESEPQKTDDHAANRFTSFDFAEGGKVEPDERLSKRKRQLSYIDRYAEIARRERSMYGIPVSITLAQGLLESDAGRSNLAIKNNNHFGIKCFSKSCAKGHCRNFSDDHHKDFFRVYPSPADSYRAHSELLQKRRYRQLKKLDPRDYRGWAEGLQRAGYATDPKYARKLIYLIETLGLDVYDA